MSITDDPPTDRPPPRWETPHGAGDPGIEGRKALHAYVSDAAHDHWHGFAMEQACSVSALLEAMAPSLDFENLEPEHFEQRLHAWVKAARKIDAARRRRRR